MQYYLFEYLDKRMDVHGAGVVEYITVIYAMAYMLSFLLVTMN